MSDDVILSSVLTVLVGLMFIIVIALVVSIVLSIIGQWKIFGKAGEPKWASLIPVYNSFVLIKVAKLEIWHFVIYLVLQVLSFVNVDVISIISTIGLLVYSFIIGINLAKVFGKGTGFGVFTAFFPFIGYMILGCGTSKYLEENN